MDTKKSLAWEEKSPFILAGLVLIFFLAKLVALPIPLFHDELEVYGKALFYMLDNGPSMIPGDVDPDISRGHPLFFIFFVSSLTAIFGKTYVTARAIILLISIALIITTYYLGKELVNKKVGIWAALFLAIQPMFFAQSTLILPEVMLSLLGSLTILFYLKNRYALYFLFGSLLILTKETGIVVFAGIVLNEWYKERFRINLNLIGRAFKWSAPISCFVLFLIVQKIQNGWFLYPYHTGFISFEWHYIYKRVIDSFEHLLLDQNRAVLFYFSIYCIITLKKEERQQLLPIHFASISVALMLFIFSAFNYFMSRYQLLIYPIFFVGLVHIFQLRRTHYALYGVYFLVTGLFYHCSYHGFRTDYDMSYWISTHNLQKGIAELDRVTEGKPAKVYAIFPDYFALQDPRYGYTSNPNYELYRTYNDSIDYIFRGRYYAYEKEAHQQKYERLMLADPKQVTNFWMAMDTLLYDSTALQQSKIQEIYNEQHYFHNARIFKTNN